MNEISPPILVRVLEKIQILGDVAVPQGEWLRTNHRLIISRIS